MKSIHKKMFADMRDKTIFAKAHKFGFRYISKAFERNVFPTKKAIQNLEVFDEPMPNESTDGEALIKMLNDYGSPATVSQVGGRYFGFVNGSITPAGLAAKLLSTHWDQNTALRVMSPISSKLESIVEKWLRELLHLPENTVAGFVSGTSMANMCGLLAARYRLLKNLGWDINKQGLYNAPKIKIIAGKQAHSAVTRALNILGIGEENVYYVNADEQGRIKHEEIPALDNSTLLILQAGNVNTGAFDEFEETCEKAKQAGAWVHIDGAFGLWAGATEDFKPLTAGMENANSWAADGHKTLNTPYDCGIVLCNDPEAYTAALNAGGAYLVRSEERDPMFYTPDMSRRSRIIELWATLKYLGKEGLNEMITEMHERAKQFAEAFETTDGFTLLNEVVFNQVLIKCDSDEITNAVLQKVQEERVCWAGGSSWNGEKAIRISVCSWATTKEDVKLSVESFKKAWKGTLKEDKQVLQSA
jgi:glutamate/tyrosine decarboxylase-like PLP-dependent enzyme